MNEMRCDTMGEKRNMSALERKVEALLQFCTADCEQTRGKYHLRLQQLMAQQEPRNPLDTLDPIDRALADLGIPDHLLGYRYLQTAIALCLEDPQKVYSMTCELYPAVAHRHDTRAQLVERSMRHAIECGWVRCDLAMHQRYFGGKVDPNRCKPTNAEFIARICNIIRRQYS